MIIDRGDKSWIAAVAAATGLSTIAYFWYSRSIAGSFGGTALGLTYGVVGTALMVFAGLLGARKKFPTLRVGRVHLWMRGHIWLGLLSFPIILLHSAFSMGGGLTSAMTILLIVIILSGIVGVVLQQIIPRMMTEQVPTEVIYEKADDVLQRLVRTAEDRVETLKPEMEIDDSSAYDLVKNFFNADIKPYLIDPHHHGLLATPHRSTLAFAHVSKLVPEEARRVVDDLRKIVQQRRDLTTQVRLHRILHGWLLVHVPLSAALLIMTVLHAVTALRYR